jgi:ABC-type Mn2+/Zn2+ transport system ATPase subunit
MRRGSTREGADMLLRPDGDPGPRAGQPAAVELATAAAGYGGHPVLEGVDLRIEPGELVGVVGPSGAGKTTLLRLLTGRADRLAGTVRVFGQAVRPRRAPRRVGYVPQLDSLDWTFPLTVEEVVLLGGAADSRPVPWFSRAERRRAHRLLERLGLAGMARRQIAELSGGQQQRMFLARAMARDADLVLLDEPTNGVDLQTRHDVLHLLGELNDDGLTIVLTTHDLNWVGAHLPRVVCLNRTIVADGAPTDVFTPDTLLLTYGAEVRVIRDGDLVFVADRTHLLHRNGRRRHHRNEVTER